MTQPNFRALCAELVNELHGYKALHPEHGTDLIDSACRELATTPPEQKSSIDELIAGCKPLDPEMAEALTTDARWQLFGEDDRAALATPPPEPPTDEERLALQEKLWGKYKTIPYQGDEFMYDDGFEYALALCDYRSILKVRWGK